MGFDRTNCVTPDGLAQLAQLDAAPKIQWLLPSKAVADEKFIPGFR